MEFSQRKILAIASKTNGRCFYCGKAGEVVDHFMPKAKAKELGNYEDVNRIDNLFIACTSCNARKSDKWPEDFLGEKKAWTKYFRTNQKFERLTSGKLETYTEAFVRQMLVFD